MLNRINTAYNVFVYVFLALFAFLMLYPILFLILSSFKTNMELMLGTKSIFPQNPTLDNFSQIWKSDSFKFGIMLGNSMYYTAANVAITLVSSSLIGYVFARAEFPLKKLWMGIFTALMFVSFGGITIYPTFEILSFFKLSGSIHGLIFTKLFGINIVNVYFIKSYISTLPRELDEAAEVDGCSFIGIFFRVLLPLLKPIIATLAILAFNGSWNDYLMPTLFTISKPNQRTLTVGIMALKNSSESVTAWNILYAGTVLSLIPVSIAYIVGTKYFVSGLVSGAVKG